MAGPWVEYQGGGGGTIKQRATEADISQSGASAAQSAAGAARTRALTPGEVEAQRTDIEYKQEQLRQLRKPPEQRSMEARAGERAKIIGSESAKAEFNLPNAEQSALTARQQLRQLMGHPGFSAAVGMPNPFYGGLGVGTIPGTPARGFTNMLGQLKGGAFLQAIESLKGSGAISEAEGDKATAAISRMETATSEADFRAAAADFDNTILNGLNIARQKSRMGGIPYSYDALKAEQERRAKSRGNR